MATLTCYLFFVVVAGLIGSFPTGYVIGQSRGLDIRQMGSGNIGATNIRRTLGKSAGTWTFLIDVSKGFLAAKLVWLQLLEFPIAGTTPDTIQTYESVLGLTAIFGHCFSPFLGFKGGKGVSTALGVFAALSPLAALGTMFVFGATYKRVGFVSVGSIAATLSLPVFIALLESGPGYVWILSISILTTILIITRHLQNIQSIIEGTELAPSSKGQD